MKLNSGVYQIICHANDKRYIGSTARLARRMIEIFSNLRRGVFSNSDLQKDFSEYGETCFSFTILENVTSDDEALAKAEEFWIGVKRSNDSRYGYNKHIAQRPKEGTREKMSIANRGEGNKMFGKAHSDESKQLMSVIKKNRGTAKGINNNRSKINQKDYEKIMLLFSEDTGESYDAKYRRIAPLFGVSPRTIKRIKLGDHHFAEQSTRKLKYKYIAVDFDGTIAEDSFPELGALKPHADRVIRSIVEHGGQVAIWTCRTGVHVANIKAFLERHEIPYHVFNEAFPEQLTMFPDNSRKIFADVYIDDRCLLAKERGIDWLEVEGLLFET